MKPNPFFLLLFRREKKRRDLVNIKVTKRKTRTMTIVFWVCAVVYLLIVLWMHAWLGILEPLMTREEIVSRLNDIYGKDFVILSSENFSKGRDQRSMRYTACPQDDPDFQFIIWEDIGGSPGPIPGYHHTLRDNYAVLIFLEKEAAFFQQKNIKCSDNRSEIYVSDETLEETVSVIADFINSLESQYPFDRATSFQDLADYCFVYESDGSTVKYWQHIRRNSDMPYYTMDAEQIIAELKERMQAEWQAAASAASDTLEEQGWTK